MRKLIVLSLSTIALIIPSISSAMDIYGEIHPERYTFFLNDKGGDDLKDLNNKMISAIGEVHPGNMQDALNINNLQKEGYDSTGLAPFIPDSIQKSTIRDDGKAVKILTCLVSTVTVPNSTRTVTMDRTWCKDEVGAEYIGFKGWPLRSAIAKSCRVGDNDCPVYLTLQGDDPTVRDDSVKFVSVHPPKVQTEPVITTKKPDPAIIADLKMNGCKIINKYRNLGPDCDSVIDVSGGGVPSDSPVTVYYIDYKKNVDMGRGSASLTYPALSLADAREVRAEKLAMLVRGVDPQARADEEAEKLQIAEESIFVNVARKWFELKESHISAAHAKDIWRSIEKDILPSIESVPIQELKARTLIQVLEPIKARGALETDLLPID